MPPRSISGLCARVVWVSLVGLVSCGGSSLTAPESLPITVYPKGTPFRITVVMKSCGDTCSKYEDGTCEVSVEDSRVELDVEVQYSRDDSAPCTERCGGQVLAHCEVGALNEGTYTVVIGDFRQEITVR